jgi:hypothetical protein
MLERLARDRHSTLFGLFVSGNGIKFYQIETKSRTSCFRSKTFDSSRFAIVDAGADADVADVDDDKLENQVMNSSVVLPIHCLKLEADTDHS